MDPHLEAIPGLGTLTTGGFAGGDTQDLGWHAHWSLHLELLVLCSTDELGTHFLKGLHVA